MTPRKKLSPGELARRLKNVKVLSFDVDGVLTDGGLYFADDGHQLRKFHAHDGVGMKRALAAGVELVIITASRTESIIRRGEALGVRHVLIRIEDKLSALTDLCRDLGVELAEAAHMGDDLNDLELLDAVGLSLAVADAVPEVRDSVHFVTERRGGEGAVREICDLLVAARVGDGPE